MAGEAPSVALIIVTYNSHQVLPGLLESLPTALKGLSHWTVVVVDNASMDNSVALADRNPVVRSVIRLHENGGYAAGINKGLEATPGYEAYLVLNPDIRLRPGSVASLARALNDPCIGVTVPRLIDEHGQLLPSLRREPTFTRMLGETALGGLRAGRWPTLGETVVDPAAYEAPTRADWATGGAMMISRDCIEAVGPWDESFFLYEDEVEFSIRARDGGFGLRLVPESEATRIIGGGPSSPQIWALMRVNKLQLYRRRHGWLPSMAYRVVITLGEGLRALAGRANSRAAFLALCDPSVLSRDPRTFARWRA